MEAPVGLQLFVHTEPSAQGDLAFNCIYAAIQTSPDFTGGSEHESHIDLTYFSLGEPRGRARIHRRAPNDKDHVDAFLCIFSCTNVQNTFNALLATNRCIDLATPENPLLVLLLEHRKIHETRKTDAGSLELYLAQHTRVGYRRFDMTDGIRLASLIHEILTTVRRARDESSAARAGIGSSAYSSVVGWLSSAATPLLCRTDVHPPPSTPPPASPRTAENPSLYSPPPIDPNVLEAGQVMIRYRLQQKAEQSPPEQPSKTLIERLFSIGGVAKAE